MKKLSKVISESATDYAEALDEIGGRDLAEAILDDDEDDVPRRALGKLKGEKRDEVRWITGWFRGVADAIGCTPVEILRAGRNSARYLEGIVPRAVRLGHSK